MKANTKKKGSPAKKLIPAAGSLMVSACMLATSTYAWFTMNKTVSVTGMEVKTKVGANLLIADDNVEANYKADQLTQGRKALLEPTSTVNGTTGSYFYTTDAKANGAKNKATSEVPYVGYSESVAFTNEGAGKTALDYNFNTAYTVSGTGTSNSGENDQAKWLSNIQTDDVNGMVAPAYGYVDYVFYLKATRETADAPVNLTKCELSYDTGALDGGDLAWRVAVFAEDITTAGGAGTSESFTPSGGSATTVGALDPARTGQTAKGILTLAGATNQTNGKAVSSGTDVDTVTYLTSESASGLILDNEGAAGSTEYYKVTVRLWLEGEDTTCTSKTYAALADDSWKLDLEFKLGEGTAIKNMTSAS